MTLVLKCWAHGYDKQGVARPRCSDALPAPASMTAGWLLIGLAFSSSAHAAVGIGPSSSASIRISVSVAPQYSLRTTARSTRVGVKRGGPDRFCLETNGLALQLPVMLIWKPDEGSAGVQAAMGKTVEVPPCGAPVAIAPAVEGADQRVSGMLIVRPE